MRTLQLLICVVCVVALSGFALATTDTMYVKSAGIAPGITTDLSVDTNHDGHADLVYGPGTVYTGVYNLANDTSRDSGQGVTISNTLGNTIHSFCMDVSQSAPSDYSQYQVISLESGPIGGSDVAMGLTRANEIRELFGRFYSQSFTNTQAAAFQAAIWEIENERTANPFDVNAGDLVVGHSNPEIQTVANGWLGSLTGNTLYYDNNVRAIGNSCNQDYVFTLGATGQGQSAVPEPLTITAAMMALGGLGMYVRKRTRTKVPTLDQE